VIRYIAEDNCKCPDAKLCVSRNRDVVLSSFGGGEPHVAARLASDAVSESTEGLGKVGAGKVAG